VLHATASDFRVRAEVKEKSVLVERCAPHQMHFVPGDVAQNRFEGLAVPLFSVHDHAKMRAGFVE